MQSVVVFKPTYGPQVWFPGQLKTRDFPLPPICTHRSQVRIRVLRVQALVVLDVLEGLIHQTAVAALVALRSGTVHQVLLAQRHQFACLPEVLTLHGSSGAEGPARATLTLRERERERMDGCVKTGRQWWRTEEFRILKQNHFTFAMKYSHPNTIRTLFLLFAWCRLVTSILTL